MSSVRALAITRLLTLVRVSTSLPRPPKNSKLNRFFTTTWSPPRVSAISAASEAGGVVTNGMSYSGRAGKNANSALLVSVSPEDFPYAGPLGGAMWQWEIERRAFEYAGGRYLAPAQLAGDFLAGQASSGPGRVEPSCRPGVF